MQTVTANFSPSTDTSMSSQAVSTVLPNDPDATQALGEWLGRRLRPGQVVALCGELGTGKTTLTRGIARGLDLDDPDAVASPTYLLVVEHPGPVPLVHADAYLPEKLAAFLADGGLDYLDDCRGVVVVEWGDRMRNLLPKSTLWVSLSVAADGGRAVQCRVDAPGDWAWMAEMPKMFGVA